MEISKFKGFRKDLTDFFKLSGIRENSKRPHHPFIVFEMKRSIETINKEIEHYNKKKTEPLVKNDKYVLKVCNDKIRELKEEIKAPTGLKRVYIEGSPFALLSMPDDNIILCQWEGQWKSDFFMFQIWELKEYIKENPKQGHHVI